MGLITDPSTGLLDNVDYILLAGATGLHERFGKIYTLVNGNIDKDNLKINSDFPWTGNHTFEVGKLKVKGAGAGIASFEYENTASDRTHKIPAKSGNDTFAMISDLNNGMISNARLVLSAGVLKLVGDDGNDPSSSNPVIASVPSSTAGKWDQISITSPTHCTIQDATSADSYFNGGGGVTFGTTTGRAWGEVMPFMIYVATDGTTPVLFLSRNPAATKTPATIRIGYKDTPPATDSQLNFFAWSATNVTVTHADVFCYPIGTLLMTKSAANDWTITGLASSGGGVGQFKPFMGTLFRMPSGQNGADSGKWFTVSGGGTAPTYNNATILSYSIDLTGEVTITAYFIGTGTAGAGAGYLNLHLPYSEQSSLDAFGSADHINQGVSSNICIMTITSATAFANFIYQGNLGATFRLVGDDQSSVTGKQIRGTIKYKGF